MPPWELQLGTWDQTNELIFVRIALMIIEPFSFQNCNIKEHNYYVSLSCFFFFYFLKNIKIIGYIWCEIQFTVSSHLLFLLRSATSSSSSSSSERERKKDRERQRFFWSGLSNTGRGGPNGGKIGYGWWCEIAAVGERWTQSATESKELI